METAQVVICQSCQCEVNGYERMPMILPCSHIGCFNCFNETFQKNRSIRCVQQGCQQVHNVHPASLKQDEKMLSYIEQRAFSKISSLLQNQETSVRSALGQLVEQQTIFIQQVMKHISDYVFSDSLQLQKELQQIEKAIKLLFNQLIIVQGQKNQQQKQLLIQEIGQRSQPLEQKIQKQLEETQRIYQQKSQVNVRVFEELEMQKLNLAQVNQVCFSFQNQIQYLIQQIQDLQKEKVKLEDQIQDLQKSNQQQQQLQLQLQQQVEVSIVNPPMVQVQICYDTSQGNISLLFQTKPSLATSLESTHQKSLLTINISYRVVVTKLKNLELLRRNPPSNTLRSLPLCQLGGHFCGLEMTDFRQCRSYDKNMELPIRYPPTNNLSSLISCFIGGYFNGLEMAGIGQS